MKGGEEKGALIGTRSHPQDRNLFPISYRYAQASWQITAWNHWSKSTQFDNNSIELTNSFGIEKSARNSKAKS